MSQIYITYIRCIEFKALGKAHNLNSLYLYLYNSLNCLIPDIGDYINWIPSVYILSCCPITCLICTSCN